MDDLKKQFVLVLNKVRLARNSIVYMHMLCLIQVDLVPPQVAVAWKHYFMRHFPQLHVVCFTCYPNHDVSLEPTTKGK